MTCCHVPYLIITLCGVITTFVRGSYLLALKVIGAVFQFFGRLPLVNDHIQIYTLLRPAARVIELFKTDSADYNPFVLVLQPPSVKLIDRTPLCEKVCSSFVVEETRKKTRLVPKIS